MERHSLPLIKGILDRTVDRIDATGRRTRGGKLTPAVEKKKALAVRVREWLDWTAATATWISVDDEEE